ncbi:MAG: hypothetical protein DIU78_010370 [Pseudomonadota bacterium]|nr:MAG: hypothetical protein DIU78_14530 [Pseudomonadota bacterium]
MVSGGGISLFELVVLGLTSSAAPGMVPVRVDFEAPPGCSDANTFLQGLRARDARIRIVSEGAEALRFSVRLRRAGRKVNGELRIVGEHGATDTRRVEGATCDEVVAALSLTAALASDAMLRDEAFSAATDSSATGTQTRRSPGSVREQRGTEPASQSGSQDETTVRETEARDRPARAATGTDEATLDWATAGTPSGPHVLVGIQLLATQVVDPVVNGGLSAFGRFRSTRDSGFGLSFGLAVAHARNGVFGAPRALAVRWTGLVVTACPLRVELGSVDLEPCALGAGGFLFAEGRDVAVPRSALRSWWSAGALARAGAPIGSGVSLEIELGMSVPLFRRRFITTLPEELVGESPTLSTLASVGLSLEL